MRCIDFDGSNITLKGDGKNVYDIRAAQFKTPEGGKAFLTLWEFERADLEHWLRCMEAGNIPAVKLYVIGNGFPPVALQLCSISPPGVNAQVGVVPPAAPTTIDNTTTEKPSDAASAQASDDQSASPKSQHEPQGRGGLPETDPLSDLGKRLGIQRQQGVPGPSGSPS